MRKCESKKERTPGKSIYCKKKKSVEPAEEEVSEGGKKAFSIDLKQAKGIGGRGGRRA